jgi:hypothetical protein
MELPFVVDGDVVDGDGADASLVAVGWAVDQVVRHGAPLRLVEPPRGSDTKASSLSAPSVRPSG